MAFARTANHSGTYPVTWTRDSKVQTKAQGMARVLGPAKATYYDEPGTTKGCIGGYNVLQVVLGIWFVGIITLGTMSWVNTWTDIEYGDPKAFSITYMVYYGISAVVNFALWAFNFSAGMQILSSNQRNSVNTFHLFSVIAGVVLGVQALWFHSTYHQPDLGLFQVYQDWQFLQISIVTITVSWIGFYLLYLNSIMYPEKEVVTITNEMANEIVTKVENMRKA